MTSSWALRRLLVMTLVLSVGARGTNSDQMAAEKFLKLYDEQAQEKNYDLNEKYWTYYTNLTKENQKVAEEADNTVALWKQEMARQAAKFDTSNFPPDMQRQFAFIKDIGTAAMEDIDKLNRLNKVQSQMTEIYSKAKVCLEKNKCLPLEPDIVRIFENSRNESLLRELWSGWRDETGRKMKQLYSEFVSLSNDALRTLGYEDTGDYWRSRYETENFREQVDELFEQIMPFYEQLHAFVRRRLKQHYPEDVFPSSGHIPAHLLGNMWAQSWDTISELLMPYTSKGAVDVTEEMAAQKYTAKRIFQEADKFFTSLGLEPMPQTFWDKSMLEKPTDGREVVCHASAWDFYNGKDFRVKQCTDVTMTHFFVAHHEMGHIVYDMLYRHLPVVFRNGANAGFHEAVGDTIALSVKTPTHLHQIGLLRTMEEDKKSELNFLMSMALNKIAFLPFGYLIDLWRWDVFSGKVTPDKYTQHWWNYRCGLQGISPPVTRGSDDFDPGAKFHVPGNTAYIRYFISHIIQFHFHEVMCKAAGHKGPLHTCDVYKSTAAGDKLRAMLSKGSSQVWTEPFKGMTGQTRMTAEPLLKYFKPLIDYLEEENGKAKEDAGWDSNCPTPMARGSPK